MRKKTIQHIAFLNFGIILLLAGIILFFWHNNEIVLGRTTQIICMVAGAALIIFQLVTLIRLFAGRNNLEFKREIERDNNDERMVLLVDKAKAGAFNFILIMLVALFICFLVIGVDSIAIYLTLLCLVLSVVFYVVCFAILDKRM